MPNIKQIKKAYCAFYVLMYWNKRFSYSLINFIDFNFAHWRAREISYRIFRTCSLLGYFAETLNLSLASNILRTYRIDQTFPNGLKFSSELTSICPSFVHFFHMYIIYSQPRMYHNNFRLLDFQLSRLPKKETRPHIHRPNIRRRNRKPPTFTSSSFNSV